MEKHCRTRQAIDDNIIQRMRIACWIPKAKKHRICSGSCFSTVTVAARTLVSVVYTYIAYLVGSRDISVGIATRYGLDGLGIESRWGRDFS